MKHFALFGLLSIFLLGCNDKPAPPADASAGSDQGEHDHNHEHDHQTTEGGLPFKISQEPRADLEFWLLYVCQDQTEVPLGMVLLQKTGENYAIEVRPITGEPDALQLTEGSATAESISLMILGHDAGYSFQGTFRDGVIWGNTILKSGECVPSRMVRPGEQLDAPPEPSPYEGHADFRKALEADADWDSLHEFIAQHPRSPYVINAFYGLFAQCGPRRMSNEELDSLFDLVEQSTEQWGERLREFTMMNAVMSMTTFYSYPAYLTQKLETIDGVAEDKIWEEILSQLKERVRDRIELARRIEEVPDLEPEPRAQFLQNLPDEIGPYQFDPFLLAKLGDVLAEARNDELAAEYYAKLAALPGLEPQYLAFIGDYREQLGSISERLETVWKRLHDDDISGLDEFKLQTYERVIEEFDVDLSGMAFDSESPNILVELFTSSSCPPCVAADIACSILRAKLPPERVTFLQYHLHIPSFDPLTNPDSEARFFLYGGGGTPVVYLNGRSLNSLGGNPFAVPGNVHALLSEIRKELGLKADLRIELNGTRSAEDRFSCAAEVVTDTLSSRWKLFVVLAEEEIHFTGFNGVPIHEMVVRKNLTSSQGVEPRNGKLAWNGTVALDQLRDELNEGLTRDEGKYNYQFPEKPLDLKRLHLVAFVQDRQNNRIRQVQSVPLDSSPEAEAAAGSTD